VIHLTGYASAEDAARARVAGYQTHMAKPVAPSDLVAAVASLATEASLPSGVTAGLQMKLKK
jgi:CheY-like chemotaxis protein